MMKKECLGYHGGGYHKEGSGEFFWSTLLRQMHYQSKVVSISLTLR